MTLHIESEREAEIGVNAPFVVFIENHNTNAGKVGRILNVTGQNSLGDNFDPRRSRHPRFPANPIAYGLADCFSKLCSHELCCALSRETPRLKHHHMLSCKPIGGKERNRHSGGFAGSRVCTEHD